MHFNAIHMDSAKLRIKSTKKVLNIYRKPLCKSWIYPYRVNAYIMANTVVSTFTINQRRTIQILWYYAMHTDNRSVGQYSFYIIVHHFMIENLRRISHT